MTENCGAIIAKKSADWFPIDSWMTNWFEFDVSIFSLQFFFRGNSLWIASPFLIAFQASKSFFSTYFLAITMAEPRFELPNEFQSHSALHHHKIYDRSLPWHMSRCQAVRFDVVMKLLQALCQLKNVLINLLSHILAKRRAIPSHHTKPPCA